MAIYFTTGVSLSAWEQHGHLSRELEFLTMLVERGIQVTLVTYDLGPHPPPGVDLPSGVDVLYRSANVPPRLYSFLAPIIWRKQLGDVTIHRSNQVSGAWSAYLAARLTGGMFVFRCGYLKSKFVNGAGRSVRARMWALLERLLAVRAQLVLVGNSEDRATLEQAIRREAALVHRHPNGVTLSHATSWDPSKGDRSAVTVGRLVPQKNHLLFLQACDLAGVDSVTVVGDGPLRDVIRNLGQSLFTEFSAPGRLDHETTRSYMADHFVYVSTSHYEGSPKALLEAMAAGMPIVATDVPGNRDVIDHMRTGLLCGYDACSVADAIDLLLSNPKLAARLGRAAKAEAAQRFSVTAMANREVDLIRAQQILQ
jgi:glycosyltransferase involved in cell wall biosynthesis